MPFLGVIADDVTGATDIASMLVSAGMRVALTVGVPGTPPDSDVSDLDAHIIALKTRTAPRQFAVTQSVQALEWLQTAGCQRHYLKYSSTFDSTPCGNIGPVSEALLGRLGEPLTIACPALPAYGRTVYLGHLFVGDSLLSESSMRYHPLTPMTEPNLVRLLQAQVCGQVGLVPLPVVIDGAESINSALADLTQDGAQFAVVDAVTADHLRAVAAAAAPLRLLTGGSGLARWLPSAYRTRDWVSPCPRSDYIGAVDGPAAVIAGSCSRATLSQVDTWQSGGRASVAVDADALLSGRLSASHALDRALAELRGEPVLVYSTALPEKVAAAQAQWGIDTCSSVIERALAEIARGLVAAGIQRLIVAGGETSGSVVQALGVTKLRIGPDIEPGVPWTRAHEPPLLLALKSGNFGSPRFFDKALALVG